MEIGDSGKTERPFRFSGTLIPLETERQCKNLLTE